MAVVHLSVTARSLSEGDELPNVTEINREWHSQVTQPIVSKNKAASSKTVVGAHLLLQALPDFPFEISLPPIPSPYSTFLGDLAGTSTYCVSHHKFHEGHKLHEAGALWVLSSSGSLELATELSRQ